MLTSLQITKIGNLLVYLAKKIQNLNVTKALKLLYIIDETAVKETGTPLTWLTYQVWEMGPVANEIYEQSQKVEQSFLKDYIKIEKQKIHNYDTNLILANSTFDDGEFNDYEMALIDQIIEKYGNLSAKQLINILHEENSLWHKKVQENELKKLFEIYSKKSSVNIQFTDLIQQDSLKLYIFKSALEGLNA